MKPAPSLTQDIEVLKALAQPVRLQILEILMGGPICVCDLARLTGQRQPYISQQLIVLKGAGLVDFQSDGPKNYYRLNRTRISDTLQTLSLLGREPQPQLKQGDRKMSEPKNNDPWHGIPRREIDWHPTIAAERCIGCGLCVTSCGRNVYAFDFEANRPVVVAPLMCMVGCTTCATNCTRDAIEFPSTGYIRQLIRERKVVRQAKDMLKAAPEKYDLRLRQTEQ